MMKFRIYYYPQKASKFKLSIRFTDGVEPILITNDFNEVIEKMKEVKKALPQINDADGVILINPSNNIYGGK